MELFVDNKLSEVASNPRVPTSSKGTSRSTASGSEYAHQEVRRHRAAGGDRRTRRRASPTPCASSELDFEANLAVVRQCVKYKQR